MEITVRLIKQYILNVLIAIDQLANALVGGDPDETLCSRAGKLLDKANPPGWAKFVEWFTEFFDKNHVHDAEEHDEGKHDLAAIRAKLEKKVKDANSTN